MTYQGVNALEDTFALGRDYELPLREQSIIVTSEGYYPKSISAFVDERMRFFVTSTTENKECFILRDKDIFLSVVKGKISEGEVVFNEAGVYEYYCPTNNLKGSLTVIERPSALKRKRELASYKDKSIKVWMPREE